MIHNNIVMLYMTELPQWHLTLSNWRKSKGAEFKNPAISRQMNWFSAVDNFQSISSTRVIQSTSHFPRGLLLLQSKFYIPLPCIFLCLNKSHFKLKELQRISFYKRFTYRVNVSLTEYSQFTNYSLDNDTSADNDTESRTCIAILQKAVFYLIINWLASPDSTWLFILTLPHYVEFLFYFI